MADILDAPVDRPVILETTALGAAWLAGSRAGVWPKQKAFAKKWALDRCFEPSMDATERKRKIAAGRRREADARPRRLAHLQMQMARRSGP